MSILPADLTDWPRVLTAAPTADSDSHSIKRDRETRGEHVHVHDNDPKQTFISFTFTSIVQSL